VNQNTVPSSDSEVTPNRGPTTDPNPGERSRATDRANAPLHSAGTLPARGNRAGGGQQVDVGARVGVMRNLEFSAGGRAHRLSTGSYSTRRPVLDPKSGRIHVGTAIDSTDQSVGRKSPTSGQVESPMPARTEPSGDFLDGSTGDTSPDRRRDKRTP
jgi:hypothetical protein